MITTRISRNDPCPCGSGKKYKHCCLRSSPAIPSSKPIAPTLLRQNDARVKVLLPAQPSPRLSSSTSQEKRDWQEIQVIFNKPDGDMALLQIIYSRDWLQSRKVTIGWPIQLNIPKYKIRGEGKVRAIRPSAEIPSGEGLVTACVHLRPEPEDAGLPPVNEREWQQLHVQVADLKGCHVYMVILHSKEWMQQHGIVGKDKLFVDMPERGVRGEGHVTLVEPSPIRSDGEGRIMTFAQTNRPFKFEPRKPSRIGIRTYFGERLPPVGHEWVQITLSSNAGTTSDFRLVRSKEWMESNWHKVEELRKEKDIAHKVDELRLVHVTVEVQDHQKVHLAFFWPQRWVDAHGLTVGEPVLLRLGLERLSGEGEVKAIAPAPYAPGEDEPHGMICIAGKRGDNTKGTIETMEVGDYVTTYTHEERRDRLPIDDTQGKWVARQRVRLNLDKEDGNYSSIVLLREKHWVLTEKIAAGGSVYLNMPEMGCVGHARVEAIEPCLVFLRWGNSSIRMVTGTFKHSEGWCGDLKLKGESKPIGVTPLHPFWSEDRQGWVSVGELRPGETVKTLKGTTTVESYTMCDKPEPTFNMEVEGDHVYRVGDQGILVHNASTPTYGPTKSITFMNCNKMVTATVGTSAKITLDSSNVGGMREDLATPTWWNDLKAVAGPPIQKGHILASQLGGKETGEKNLTPLYVKPNTPAMNTCETFLRRLVDDCKYCAVDVTITVNGYGENMYKGVPDAARPVMPKSITIAWKVDDKTNGTFVIENDPQTATQDPCRVKNLPCRK